jgi:hypothetical protein
MVDNIYSAKTDRVLDFTQPVKNDNAPYVDEWGVTQQVVADYTGASYPVASQPNPSAKPTWFEFKGWRPPGLGGNVRGSGNGKADVVLGQDTPLKGTQRTIGRQGEVNFNEVEDADGTYFEYRVAAQGAVRNTMTLSVIRGVNQEPLPPDPTWTTKDNQRMVKELADKGILGQYSNRDQERLLNATSEADFNREAELNEAQLKRDEASSLNFAGSMVGSMLDDAVIGAATGGASWAASAVNKARQGVKFASKARTFGRKAEREVFGEVVGESAKETTKNYMKTLRNGGASNIPTLPKPSPGFGLTNPILPEVSFSAAIREVYAISKPVEEVTEVTAQATTQLTKKQLARARKMDVKAKKAANRPSKKYPQVDEVEEQIRDKYGVSTINKGTPLESQVISHPRLWKEAIFNNSAKGADDLVEGFWQSKGTDIVPKGATSSTGVAKYVPKTYSKIPYADGAVIKNFTISPRAAALAAVLAQTAGSSYAYSKNELRMADVIGNIIGSLANPALYKGLKKAKEATPGTAPGTGLVVQEVNKAFKDVPPKKRYEFINTLKQLGYTKTKQSTEGVRTVTGALERDAKLGYTPKTRTPDIMDVEWEEVIRDYNDIGLAKESLKILGDYTKAVKNTTDFSDLIYNGKTGYNLVVQSAEGDFFGGIQFPKPTKPSKEMLKNTADGGQEWVFPDKPPQPVWQIPDDWIDLDGMPFSANIKPMGEELLAITSKPEWIASTVRPTVDNIVKDIEKSTMKLNKEPLTYEEFTALMAHRDGLINSLPIEYHENLATLDEAMEGIVEYKPISTVLKDAVPEPVTQVDKTATKTTSKEAPKATKAPTVSKTKAKATTASKVSEDTAFNKDVKAREKAIADLTKFVESKLKAKDRLKDPSKIAKVVLEIAEAKTNLSKAKRNLKAKLDRVMPKQLNLQQVAETMAEVKEEVKGVTQGVTKEEPLGLSKLDKHNDYVKGVVKDIDDKLKAGLSADKFSKLVPEQQEKYMKVYNAVNKSKAIVNNSYAPTLGELKAELSGATDIYEVAALKRRIIKAEKDPIGFEEARYKALDTDLTRYIRIAQDKLKAFDKFISSLTD